MEEDNEPFRYTDKDGILVFKLKDKDVGIGVKSNGDQWVAYFKSGGMDYVASSDNDKEITGDSEGESSDIHTDWIKDVTISGILLSSLGIAVYCLS